MSGSNSRKPSGPAPKANKPQAQAAKPSAQARRPVAPAKPGPKPTTAREAALDILTRVERDRSYSNLLLGRSLERLSLSRADAGLATELVYGTIQRRNTLDDYLSRFVAKGLGKLEPWVLSLLRMSLYQLLYLDRVPAHAAVSEAVNIAKRRGHSGISGMVNAVLRNVLRRKAELVPDDSLPAVRRISLGESHPEWLVKRYVDRYGEAEAERVLAANNEPPHSSLRVNRMKAEPAELARELRAEGVPVRFSALPVPGLVVAGGGNLAETERFRSGVISIQDESSMLVAEALAPEPGMRVLDCCAAPGGKTAHIAEKLAGRGEVVSCDIHPHKEALIAAQAQRLGLSVVKTVVADARELGSLYPPESFDRILLDAPCSGLGVIRRKPELKWTKREEEIAELAHLQEELLEAVHGLLKPGGVLVYSTCTTEPEENAQQAEAFLRRHPEFRPEPFPDSLVRGLASPPVPDEPVPSDDRSLRLPSEERRRELAEAAERGSLQLLPSDFGTDGFFIARFGKRTAPMIK